MSLVQFSNVLNLMVQHSNSQIEWYQYGYRPDMNVTRQNNFAQSGSISRSYPSLMLEVPDGMPQNSNQLRAPIRLWFDQLVGRDALGNPNANTALEKQSELMDIATNFMKQLELNLTNLALGIYVAGEPTYEISADIGNDNTVILIVSTTLILPIDCNGPDLQLGSITIAKEDIERTNA